MIVDKILNIILSLAVVTVATTFGFWFWERTPPIQIMEAVALTPRVGPGEIFRVQLHVRRSRSDCRLHLDRMIFDGLNTRAPISDEEFEANPSSAEEEMIVESAQIPDWAAPGPSIFRIIRAYYCNPVQWWFDRPIVVRAPDVAFEIVTNETALSEPSHNHPTDKGLGRVSPSPREGLRQQNGP